MRWGSCTRGGPTDHLDDRVGECGWWAADARDKVPNGKLNVTVGKLLPIMNSGQPAGLGRLLDSFDEQHQAAASIAARPGAAI